MKTIYPLFEVLIVLIPMLMSVAFVTVAERKIMAAMQRRVGPNAVGLWGLLQPFADALKLLVKEIIIPRQSNRLLFVVGPCITLIFALLGWAIIPFSSGLAIFDYELGVFFALAVSSLGSYGILISGWAANSKYAFMGAIRSTAQLLSYELVFSSIILILIIFSGSFSLTFIVECQQAIWNIFPLMPIALMFFIAILAETNRPPFDLPEAESELVAGFMTEHGASIFVFFFLGEYSSLILMSAFMSIFFLGGYHFPELRSIFIDPFIYFYSKLYTGALYLKAELQSLESTVYKKLEYSDYYFYYYNTWIKDPVQSIKQKTYNRIFSNLEPTKIYEKIEELFIEVKGNLFSFIGYNPSFNNNLTSIRYSSGKDIFVQSIEFLLDKAQGSFILGIKIIFVVFFFIWVRASFPRLRYDQLMSLCWKELLPLVFGYIIFTICIFYTFNMMPVGTSF
jgi:NADH-ubiquinone oxidoreductase chain 1